MIDYSDKNSLIKLAKNINRNYIDDKARYLAKLHFANLIVAELPWYVKILLNRVHKKYGYDAAVEQLYNIYMNSNKNDIDMYYDRFLHNIVHGNNTTDINSAGGFNKVEIIMISSIFGLIGE